MARNNKWKNPTILEHLLHDERKCKKLVKALTDLGLEVKAHTGGKWFDIVEKGK